MKPQEKAILLRNRHRSMITNARAKGIKVTAHLKTFENFTYWAWDLIDRKDLFLTRYDTKGDYSRRNCYWRIGKHEDLEGKIFGRLKAIKRLRNSPEGSARWRCICQRCGSTGDLNAQCLKRQTGPCFKCRKSQ